MQKILIFLVTLFFSCHKLPVPVGDDNEIIIIASESYKRIISTLISPLFENFINTPVEENIYSINWINSLEFNSYMKYKNILVISVDNPIDSTIDLLNKKFFDISKNKYGGILFIRFDIFIPFPLIDYIKCSFTYKFDWTFHEDRFFTIPVANQFASRKIHN